MVLYVFSLLFHMRVFIEVYVVFSAGSEDLFDVFHVCWEVIGVNQQVIEVYLREGEAVRE